MVAEQFPAQPELPARRPFTERLRPLLSAIIARVRSPWVAPPLVLFVAACAYFAYGMYQQDAQQGDLARQLKALGDIAASGATQERLAAAEARLKAVQEAVPPSTLQEIDVFRAMWDMASSIGLDPTKVSIEQKGPTATQRVGNTQFRVLAFSMSVAGDSDAVWDLVRRMDSGQTPYKTLAVQKTDLSFGGRSSNASLEFSIYTRAGEG